MIFRKLLSLLALALVCSQSWSSPESMSIFPEFKSEIIRGSIESGSTQEFQLSPFVAHPTIFGATARIISGPHAGSEDFDLRFTYAANPPYQEPFDRELVARGTGAGNRSLPNRGNFYFGVPYLVITFPNSITEGNFEITFSLIPSSIRGSGIQVKDRERLSRRKFRVTIVGFSRGQNSMKKLIVKAQGNPRASLISDFYASRVRNASDPFPTFGTATDFRFKYDVRLRRPVTRMVVRAENSIGATRKKVFKYKRKDANRKIQRPGTLF